MRFDYETALSAKNHYLKQASANHVDADLELGKADRASRAGDEIARATHFERATFYKEQCARFEALAREQQQQIEAAHKAGRDNGSERIQSEADSRFAEAKRIAARLKADGRAETDRER